MTTLIKECTFSKKWSSRVWYMVTYVSERHVFFIFREIMEELGAKECKKHQQRCNAS